MIRTLFGGLAAATLLLYTSVPISAQSLSFGNVNVQQNDAGNVNSSVTLTMDYVYGTLAPRPSGHSRGDFLLQLGPTFSTERAKGILITTVNEDGRQNSAGGESNSTVRYATASVTNQSGGWWVPVHTNSGGEWNINFAAAYFPYAEGWIGGHAVVTSGALSTANSALAPGITIWSGVDPPTTADTNYIYDDPATTGIYSLKLAGINSNTDGILLSVGGDNVNTYTLAKANTDGTWTINVTDNSQNGNVTEAGSFGFVYVPKTSVVTSPDQAGVQAMGRVNGNMTRDVTAGNYVVVRSGLGQYKMYAPGIDPDTAVLLLGMERDTGDNILTYGAIDHGWIIGNRDLPGAGLQDGGTGDLLSFAIMAGGNTSVVWDAGGGANRNWSTNTNWVNDGLPIAGRDVFFGSGTAVNIDSAQTVGMVFISSNTAFNITGTAPLTINSGLIVNSAPTAAQTYTVSAPIILGNHAFVISQSMGSGVTLRFDVASGNAITSDGYNLTLNGGGAIDIRDPISLGTGNLIKEGDGQVELGAAINVGRTVITSGPTGTTSAAFRLNTAGSYGFFGNTPIEMWNSRPDGAVDHTAGAMTALFFDAGAGSGELHNDIFFQSTLANSNVRFLMDAGAAMNVTLSGLMSGGNATSRVIFSSDAATGLGKFHLTNTNNTFLSEHIQLDRGALVIYGDGSLGDAENDLYLNTNNTTNLTGNGLHFGAADITLNASRRVFLATNTVIHTEGYNATIAGVISSPLNNDGVVYSGSLFKEGAGILSLTGVNTFIGKTRVNGGMVAINSEESLGAAPTAFAADHLALNNGAGLQVLADVVIDDTNRGITIGATGGTIDTNGHHLKVDSVISALGALDKRGTGTLELTAANTFSNSITVHEGTLAVNNTTASTTGAASIVVNRGAAIGGKGIIGGAVTVEGKVAPGIAGTVSPAGELTFTGGLELLAGSRVQFEIKSQEEYDRIVVTGSPLGVDASAIFEVLITGTPMAGWNFDLVDWTYLSLDDDLTDNFVLPDLSAWNLAWNKDNLSEGRMGIVTAVVPEPSRAVLLLGGVMLSLMRRRRPRVAVK